MRKFKPLNIRGAVNEFFSDILQIIKLRIGFFLF
jgi:hypothetical protein